MSFVIQVLIRSYLIVEASLLWILAIPLITYDSQVERCSNKKTKQDKNPNYCFLPNTQEIVGIIPD